MIGARRAMAAVGREVPIQVQVTIELTGRMLLGTEIGAALTALDAMPPDVIGINCATGPSEMGEHLRHLVALQPPADLRACPTPGCRRWSTARCTTTSRPPQLGEHHERFVDRARRQRHRRLLRHHARAPQAAGRRACAASSRPAAQPADEPGLASIYSHVPYDQAPSFLVVGERTNANGSKKFREAMLDGDWDTTVAMAAEQVGEGSHVIDVCVDYVGRDGTADMDEVAGRFATAVDGPAHGRLHRARRDRDRRCSGSAARPSSTRSTSRTATPRAPGSTGSSPLAKEYGAAVVAHLHRRGGPGPRRRSGSCGPPGRSTTSPSTATASSPHDLFFDPLALPLATGIEESRGDGIETIEGIRAHQGRAARASHHPRPVERQLRPQPGRPPRPQLGVPARVPGGRPRRRHRPRRPHHADQPDRPRSRSRSASTSSTTGGTRTGYDPLHELLELFEGARPPPVPRRRTAPAGPSRSG